MLTATVSVALAAVAAVLPLAAMAPTKRVAIWAISKADTPMSIVDVQRVGRLRPFSRRFPFRFGFFFRNFAWN
jgi:hypothetical protein